MSAENPVEFYKAKNDELQAECENLKTDIYFMEMENRELVGRVVEWSAMCEELRAMYIAEVEGKAALVEGYIRETRGLVAQLEKLQNEQQ